MDIENSLTSNLPGSVKECTFYQKIKKKVYIYWFNKSFGHLDQVRVDLEKSYKGEQEFIKMTDGSQIDTMWIENQVRDSNAPTVMFCNPNGVFYETFAYDGNWLEFYLNQGFNIFVWNYRGYGRSKGYISPNKLFDDADDLVKHLKNVRGVGKLLVHGISLGGGVACHLSNNPQVDVIFADRTFSSLDSVVRDDFGSILRFAYNFFTLRYWKMHCAQKFLKSTKYKILSCDPKDEMIPELASLKNGVTRAVLMNDETLNNPRDLKHKKEKNFYQLSTMLEQVKCDTMFKILEEIFTINLSKVNEMYTKAKKVTKSKPKDDDCESQSIELNDLDDQNQRQESENQFEISGTNYSGHSEIYLDKSSFNSKFDNDKKMLIDDHKDIMTHFCNVMQNMDTLSDQDSLHK